MIWISVAAIAISLISIALQMTEGARRRAYDEKLATWERTGVWGRAK